MNRISNINMYEGLASYFLPTGVLEYFEVTDFAEVPTQDIEVLYTTELHIYLDERDNRTSDMSGSVSDGFGEESCLLDFPTRDKKTVLHVRRRRWKMPDGTTKSVDLDKKIQLKHPGTRYSKDFALFLKYMTHDVGMKTKEPMRLRHKPQTYSYLVCGKYLPLHRQARKLDA